MKIAIDFDGTCVTHAYPSIGQDINAQPYLERLIKCGHDLILYTMRNGPHLEAAVQWFKDNHIELFAVNENPEDNWSNSRKVYAHLYIDDAALGIPLVYPTDERPYVDWKRVGGLLLRLGYFRPDDKVSNQKPDKSTKR